MIARKLCRHCSACVVSRPRGLCWHCWHDPAVRYLYPAGSANPATARYVPKIFGGLGREAVDGEPTMEELEAMIAEQLPTMPQTPEGVDAEYRVPGSRPRRT